jgi:hypothetical protein
MSPSSTENALFVTERGGENVTIVPGAEEMLSQDTPTNILF